MKADHDDNGRFVKGHMVGVKTRITPANARIYEARRRAIATQRAEDGIRAAVAERGITLPGAPLDWVEPIARARAIAALDPGHRDGVANARFVFAAAGVPLADQQGGDEDGGMRLEVWGDALERILEALHEGMDK
jgi:hypothetical protein